MSDPLDFQGSYQGTARGEYKVELTAPLPPELHPTGEKVPSNATIRIPGGVSVGVVPQKPPTSDCRILIDNLIPSITISLGPFGFLFCILNVILKIIDCVKAVPDCISQLSPTPIFSALAGLSGAITCLMNLLPQLSMLLMIYDILKIIIAVLECLISALTSMKSIVTELTSALNEAGNDANLKEQLLSAQAQTQVMIDQTFTVSNPLVPIFGMLNLFLPLFGQEEIEFTVPGPGTNIDTAITALTMLHDALVVIKNALEVIIGV